MTDSIASRYIATYDRLEVGLGADRIVVTGTTDLTSRTRQSTSLGVRYEQIDQLLADLLTAKRHQPQVTECNWCPDGPLVRHHPRGQVPHVP